MTRLSARGGGRAVYIGSPSLSFDVVVRQRGTADWRAGTATAVELVQIIEDVG
jgi:hypothetical protein